MKHTIIYLLRIFIIISLFFPFFFPSIKEQIKNDPKSLITLFIPSELKFEYKLRNKIKLLVQQNFGDKAEIEIKMYGNSSYLVEQDYEDLLQKIDKSKGIIVVLSNSAFWGELAQKFNFELKNSTAFQENRLYTLSLNKLLDNFQISQNYLVLSDIFIPKLSFLGEESICMISLVGKAKPLSTIRVEIVLHSGSSFLNSKTIEIAVPNDGLINQTIKIPINFVYAGVQVVTADINTPYSKLPLNTASTSVNVVFSKTTVLHIGVGPDWGLRVLRQKLKFWPNFELLSYYILREMNSDQSIPTSQLSLIEFPAEKLFGQELQNFHGIVAQNFSFENYLQVKETENLVDYVHKGGRLLIGGGPLSFLSQDENIQSLFPCVNQPQWDFQKTYHWQHNETNFSTSNELALSLDHIVSKMTAIDCKPKSDAIVLARTLEGGHPILLAKPSEKGIVLSFLAGDWFYAYNQQVIQGTSDLAMRMEKANSVETLFHWVVEFLQRRQDTGVRAPDLVGPRIYSKDNFMRVKGRDNLSITKNINILSNSKSSIIGKPFALRKMQNEVLELSKPISSFASVPLTLPPTSELTELSLTQDTSQSEVLRTSTWPIFGGKQRDLELFENPFLFMGIPILANPIQNTELNSTSLFQEIPFIKAYPWSLALILGMLAIEQFLSRILWRNISQKV